MKPTLEEVAFNLCNVAARDTLSNSYVISVLRSVAEAAALEQRQKDAKLCDAADKSTHPADLADAIRAGKVGAE